MTNRTFFKEAISSLSLFTLVLMQIVFAPISGNFNAAAQTGADAPAAIIYDNGPFQTGATSKSGVAAPAGAQFSEVQNFAGDTSTQILQLVWVSKLSARPPRTAAPTTLSCRSVKPGPLTR
jgi:hypothetical protein